MKRRLQSNKNLSLHSVPEFRGFSVQTSKGDLIEDYLEHTYQVVMSALQEYPRTFGIRFDLRMPSRAQQMPCNVISVFCEKLADIILKDRNRVAREQQYPKPCRVRYVWARERGQEGHDHYHVVIFLNRDAYHVLGDKSALAGNMAARIKLAWARAMRMDIEDAATGVYFPDNAEYRVDQGDQPAIENLFHRISYLCKAKTKNYGDRRRNFGCSRY
ncbi:inovirus Gp2 family protein [Oceanospirillum sediminis]|uniref:Inovirus Gp2 family protein n=1 Tax=Oceanospirillum sediminis TaxID=2760088 RepID=A0A839IUM7_9GAMM|nr:inovirus Gp2 family protein [Oceanospirillum sediminis]MBB1488651.1 inovirus Gp2 family protein [Oceanospirillum sediminis]